MADERCVYRMAVICSNGDGNGIGGHGLWCNDENLAESTKNITPDMFVLEGFTSPKDAHEPPVGEIGGNVGLIIPHNHLLRIERQRFTIEDAEAFHAKEQANAPRISGPDGIPANRR